MLIGIAQGRDSYFLRHNKGIHIISPKTYHNFNYLLSNIQKKNRIKQQFNSFFLILIPHIPLIQ